MKTRPVKLALLLVLASAPAIALAEEPGALRKVPDALPRLAFEVLNSKRAERHIVHLEDLIGPGSRPAAGGRAPRAMLITPIVLDQCPTCGDDLGRLATLHKETASGGGVVLAIVQTRPQDSERARKEYGAATYDFPVVLDAYGLAKNRLGLVGPGFHLVVQSDGRVLGAFGPREGGLKQAEAAFRKAIVEDDS